MFHASSPLRIPSIVAVAAVLAALTAGAARAGSVPVPGYSASWWGQIGLTSAIESTANYATGFTLGFVDTGVIANNAELSGRVSSLSSCAALTFRCANGVFDDNGHGTAVAAIAAGSTVTGGIMSGVAPGAVVLSQKVLNAGGSGYDTDVANGIIKAVNAGATVINLSIGSGSSTPVLADPAIQAAVNYAASKKVIMVWAGGNSAIAYSSGNIAGLTQAAIQDTVLVGSVNSANVKSSFSNSPGSASFVPAGGQKTAIDSMWLMAPGENIVAPGIMYGANAYAYWTGTSMAAPMVSGALALLETEWPVLQRNATGPAVLYASATDLGAKGVDGTYGTGLLNIGAAFQPIGALTVTTVKGATVTVSSLTPSILTGGALGSLASLSAVLSNYTAFDSFQRNFLVNLSGLVAKVPTQTGAQAAAGARDPQVAASAAKFSDGSSISIALAGNDPYGYSALQVRFSFADQTGAGAMPLPAMWRIGFTSAGGRTITGGSGLPATAEFAETLWGTAGAASSQSRGLGVSSGLLALTDGGTYLAIGQKLGSNTRIAASFSSASSLNTGLSGPNGLQTDIVNPAWQQTAPFWQRPAANAASFGLTTSLADGLTGGLTVGFLDEHDGLLGTSYQGSGPLGLGDRHLTGSFGQSLAWNLGDGASLLLESMVARVGGASAGAGLVSGTTPIVARAYGVSLDQQGALFDGDDLSVSVRKPLRVVSGSANIAINGVDSQGYATTNEVKVGLTPSGNQTDFNLGYNVDIGKGASLAAVAGVSADAGNVKGAIDYGSSVRFSLRW